MKERAQRQNGGGQTPSFGPASAPRGPGGRSMASVAHEQYAGREMSIGRTFSRAFGTLAANPLATLGIAFLCSALPSVVLNYFVTRYQFSMAGRIGTSGLVGFGLF